MTVAVENNTVPIFTTGDGAIDVLVRLHGQSYVDANHGDGRRSVRGL